MNSPSHLFIAIVFGFLLSGCDRHAAPIIERVGCAGGDTGTTGDDPPPPPPIAGIPQPTAPCPEFVDGAVTFCPASLLECREAVVVNAAGASSAGPLALHWHGTYEWPEGILSWDSAAQAIRSMVIDQDGIMVLPRADPDAPGRIGNPFPWWVVCADGASGCNRPDDFILADEIVACVIQEGLASPDRITTSGMSAGGIMTSHLVDRVDYLAGAVSWSGGLPEAYQPTTPHGTTAVMALHGGPTDLYCGVGGPTGCYAFQEPSETLALDVQNSGRFAVVCDHQAGHSTAMGAYGAAFLRDADVDGHVWVGYPFGYPGTGGDWMLNHYCYPVGGPSPW